ncbi:DUF4430 domain-containing protein [Fusibacter paucivorans]|uniref:DUF4430 domain-containing protein n=1 Tax=Fusibacter paucivorans TaxID=76009 RepID=A0ABS5PR80_9FIRM|nr:DUF4430 domain-containing protein [Fusibacter paucivorans]MBS7527670.1 DUF4430 domain-containing protein [Fusibacter paucivorans]
MWFKNKKKQVMMLVIMVVVLTFAFWYGGNAPGLRGWHTTDATRDHDKISYNEYNSESIDEVESTDKVESTDEVENTEVGLGDIETDTTPSDFSDSSLRGMIINEETGLDQYQTAPVPEGMPIPVEPESVVISDTQYTATLSISCSTILENMAWLEDEKVSLVPDDGWILAPMEVTFYEGESVFNVLLRTCKQLKIHMEYQNTPIYNSAYIEGIHNLYEFDCGEQSGWMYSVNGWFPNYGCSRYGLQDGDSIEWQYTCNLGEDIGGSEAVGD